MPCFTFLCYTWDKCNEGSGRKAVKRTLILDDSELIMVVKKDVVEQIDENRGEMNRTEFVNLLIQKQLQEFYDKPEDYATREDLNQSTQAVQQVLHNFVEFFLTYGLMMGQAPQTQTLQQLHDQVRALNSPPAPGEES